MWNSRTLNSGRAQRSRAGRRGGSRSGQSTRGATIIQRPPSPPLGPLIQTLTEADLLAAVQSERHTSERAQITNSEYIASFNWLDQDNATILVPGAPPAWTPLHGPRPLQEDKGNYFRDPNAARFPTYPLEPAVRALLMANDGFNTQRIDLFACGSTVGSLMRFVRRVEKPFRFLVEAVGNTVFFNRHESSPTELIPDVRGYGHTFPEAYTSWDEEVKGSASHQRLLRYNLAGLDCILRFECDGYLKSKGAGPATAPVESLKTQGDELDDDISLALDRIKMASALEHGEKNSGVLKVVAAGRNIPQDAVFDLKTRSKRKLGLDVLKDELPRYWVAQIPNFILARHDSGVFDDIQVQNISADVKKWEQDNQTAIKQLRWILRKLIAVAQTRRDKKLEVRWKSLGVLELHEQDSEDHNVLPLELKMQWMGGDFSEEAQSQSGSESAGGVSLPCSSPSPEYGVDSDEEIERDYTACSAEDCGYCGQCSY